MRRLNGQVELMADNYPTLEDEDLAADLERADRLREGATEYQGLMKGIKEKVKGFVLGLAEEDRGVGKVRVGDFLIPFTLKEEEEQEVEFTRGGGTKVTLKLKPEEDAPAEE